MGCLNAQWGVLDDNSLGGAYAGLLQSHEIGFGVGLAVLHVEGGDHAFRAEDAGEVMGKAGEQGVLGAAGDEHDGETQ